MQAAFCRSLQRMAWSAPWLQILESIAEGFRVEDSHINKKRKESRKGEETERVWRQKENTKTARERAARFWEELQESCGKNGEREIEDTARRIEGDGWEQGLLGTAKERKEERIQERELEKVLTAGISGERKREREVLEKLVGVWSLRETWRAEGLETLRERRVA